MEACAASERYQHSTRKRHRFLGDGGCSGVFERWFDTESSEWCAAKYVLDVDLAQTEVKALELASQLEVFRVAKLKDDVPAPDGSHILIFELVEGLSVAEYMDIRFREGWNEQTEARMFATAAPLLETLCKLHYTAGLAHMDLTSSNIMMSHKQPNGWDKLLLIDFGMSQMFSPGVGVKDVRPMGLTLEFAPPELLLTVQVAHQHHVKPLKVNGPAVDMWSAGVVLYDMLTGKLPFAVDSEFQHKHMWQLYKAALKEQQSWIAAVELAEETHTPVKHPLLDQVRKYTSTPEAAAAFFIAVLHPTPRARLTSLQALNHPYLKQCVQQMQDFYHPPPSDPPRSRLDILASAPLPDTPGSGSLLHTLGSASKWVLEASIC